MLRPPSHPTQIYPKREPRRTDAPHFCMGPRQPLGERRARLRMDCTADLLLVFVLDKNASGTARSKTDSRQLSPFSMLLLAFPDAVSSHKKTSSKSAVQTIFCVIPHRPRGSLIPYKSEENQFHPVLASIEPCAPMLLQ